MSEEANATENQETLENIKKGLAIYWEVLGSLAEKRVAPLGEAAIQQVKNAFGLTRKKSGSGKKSGSESNFTRPVEADGEASMSGWRKIMPRLTGWGGNRTLTPVFFTPVFFKDGAMAQVQAIT